MNPSLDLDMAYPECERRLDNPNSKWVRRIYKTTLNRQIFPVYTSMENMTQSHHNLTVAQMKDITFQVIPQFYWRYEWSYNDFMIHRVGRLNPHTDETPLYDMLGNVWEWVRDDWSENVSTQNGKVNPIVGTTSGATEPPPTKVIKGGAFDQFCRKTISPSREGLDWNKFQSRYGT